VKHLVVNADDFGMTAGINSAIVEAHTSGIITSTTLMANGPAFSGAVRASELQPYLGVGCHIVLVDGEPLLPPNEVRSLLGHDPQHFRTTIAEFAKAASMNQLNPDEIEAEATAQIHKLQGAGIEVSHVDAHKHAHMFPAVLVPILRAAAKCGVKAIRNPFEPSGTLPLNSLIVDKKLAARAVEVSMLRILYRRRFLGKVRHFGLSTTEGSLGVAATGSLDLLLFEQMVKRMADGTWELVCHPGHNDVDLANARTRLRRSRGIEFELLASARARTILEENEVRLISYHTLPRLS